jgi:Fur family zinc uptake transcriptional regulator
MSAATHDLTRNQALVLGVLNEAQTPLSAYDILDHLKDEGFRAPLQVYRALDKLVEQGMVHRLESLNAFVACSHVLCHDTGLIAFAICEDCGHVSEFSDTEVSRRLDAWVRKNRFSPGKTTIEIRGHCAACAAG